MAKELLTLVVKGTHGEIPVHSFVRAVKKFQALLSELSKEFSDENQKLSWVITKLKMESPPAVGIGLRDIPADFDVPGFQVNTIAGFESLKSSKARPNRWSEHALSVGRDLCHIIDKHEVDGISILDTHRYVDLDSDIISSVDTILPPQASYGESFGSIDGTLDDIYAHSDFSVGIYRSLDGRAVKAHFRDVSESKYKWAMDNLKSRIYAEGKIVWDRHGEPKEIFVKDIDLYERPEDCPSIFDLWGKFPDFTGSESTEDFVRRMRDEQ